MGSSRGKEETKEYDLKCATLLLSNQMHDMMAPRSIHCMPHTPLGVHMHALSFILKMSLLRNILKGKGKYFIQSHIPGSWQGGLWTQIGLISKPPTSFVTPGSILELPPANGQREGSLRWSRKLPTDIHASSRGGRPSCCSTAPGRISGTKEGLCWPHQRTSKDVLLDPTLLWVPFFAKLPDNIWHQLNLNFR